MSEIKGQKLFVNVGPSEARRRLKGFGHGVRKVQSNGRNQAVIIHTATRQNLTELEAKFADVGFASRATELAEPIENLRNLGPTSCRWLHDMGVYTIDELRKLGAVDTFRIVKRSHPEASLNLLYALVAGLADRDFRDLSEEEKQTLREAVFAAD